MEIVQEEQEGRGVEGGDWEEGWREYNRMRKPCSSLLLESGFAFS